MDGSYIDYAISAKTNHTLLTLLGSIDRAEVIRRAFSDRGSPTRTPATPHAWKRERGDVVIVLRLEDANDMKSITSIYPDCVITIYLIYCIGVA